MSADWTDYDRAFLLGLRVASKLPPSTLALMVRALREEPDHERRARALLVDVLTQRDFSGEEIDASLDGFFAALTQRADVEDDGASAI